MKFTPASALEAQHEQFAFSQSSRGLAYWSSFNGGGSQHGGALQQAETLTLRTAPTYLVAPSMFDLALHAARSMPDVPLVPKDLPSPSGFCLFAEPALAPDVHGKMVSMAGFSWHIARDPQTTGVLWVIYSDLSDKRDAYYDLTAVGEQGLPKLLPVGHNYEPFGDPSLSLEEVVTRQGGDEQTVTEAILHMRKLPLCIFALMQQTLVSTTPTKPQRATRRRLKRLDSPLHDKLVKIVRLRHVRHRDERSPDAQPVDWSHRWIVNGHWRMQPTKDGVKRIWIMPFVKGPEDKPLMLKETIHVLDR